MKKLYNSLKTNDYANSSMIGKYIYLKRNNKEMDIHYIFNIEEIVSNNPVEYITGHQFYFCIPFDKERKCYCYDSESNIKLQFNDVLYEMTYEEWLNTFRVFVANEAKHPNEIPSKIIQDKECNFDK